MASPEPLVTDPLAPIEPLTPQGDVVALSIPNVQDYPRLVFAAPYHTMVAIADIIEPSVMEAVQGILPTLVPPYVNQAAIDAVNALAVRRVGDTMTGPLYLFPVLPTQPAQAASKSYVDTIVATVVPEVPPVPAGQIWGRQTGQWTPLGVGGTVTNIATGAGLTGGPITGTGTISMANMGGLTLKGNNSASVAAPADLTVAQTMTMLGAAPLNSPTFGGTPSLPTGTIAITQPPTTNNTTVATTAFVNTAITTATGAYLPLAGGTLTGALTVDTAANPGLLVSSSAVIGNAVTSPPAHALVINASAAPPSGALTVAAGVAAYSADGSAAAMTLLSNNNPSFRTVGYAGTAASPGAISFNGVLGQLSGYGYDGATASGAVSINLLANEAWGPAAHGSRIDIYTVNNGSATQTAKMTISNGVYVLASGTSPTGGDMGSGTFNVGGGYFLNGQNITAGHLPGTGTNDNALAGQVGEVISAINNSTALVANTPLNLCTISLTPGDWDVNGEIWVIGAGNSYIEGGMTTASATVPTSPSIGSSLIKITDAGLGDTALSLSTARVLVAVTGNYYLVVQSSVAATGVGKIMARRAR